MKKIISILSLAFFSFLAVDANAQFGGGDCTGCPQYVTFNYTYNCNCVNIVAFIDGMVDPPSCYSYSWDFGPYATSVSGGNTLTPYVCFDNTAIYEATGQTGFQTITIFLDVWKNGCLQTFSFNITILAC